MPSRRRTAVWLAALVAFAWLPAAATEPAVREAGEYEVKAHFLERFTRFVAWPESALPAGGREPFVIGIVGRDPFGDALRDLAAGREVEGHPIELRRVREAGEMAGCHLLFVAGSESERLDEVLAATRRRPVLTVGDTAGYAHRGLVLNLFVEDGRVGFEVNERAAREGGLELSSRLLRLARPLEEAAP